MGDYRLEQAISVIKAGNRAKGRRLLLAVLNDDPQNERAWLWMSAVVANQEQQRQCLETVLQINPQNEKAREGLARLQTRTMVDEPVATETPSQPRPPDTVVAARLQSSSSEPKRDNPRQSKPGSDRLLYILAGFLLLCICCASPFVVLSSFGSVLESAASGGSEVGEQRDIPPTYTPGSQRQTVGSEDFSNDRTEYGEIAISRPRLAEYAERSSLGMSFYRDLNYNDGTYHHTMCTRNCEQKLVMRSETYDRNELDNLDFSFIYANSDQFTMRSLSMLAIVGLAIPVWDVDLDRWYLESAENYLKTGRETYYASKNGIDVQLDFFYDTIDLEDAVIISVME